MPTMFCHNCGAKVDAQARFCARCGTALNPSSAALSGPTSVGSAPVGSAPVGSSPVGSAAPGAHQSASAVSARSQYVPSVSPRNAPYELNVRVPDFATLQRGAVKKPGRWRGISLSGAGLMLIAFVLPWVSASCDPRALGASVQNLPVYRFSGLDLAVGPRIETPFGTQQGSGSVILWLVPAMALVVIGCVLFIKNHRLAAMAAMVAAVASLVPMLSAWQGFESQRNAFTKISIEFGLWLSLLGVILAAVGGLVGLSASTAESPASTTPPAYANLPEAPDPRY